MLQLVCDGRPAPVAPNVSDGLCAHSVLLCENAALSFQELSRFFEARSEILRCQETQLVHVYFSHFFLCELYSVVWHGLNQCPCTNCI